MNRNAKLKEFAVRLVAVSAVLLLAACGGGRVAPKPAAGPTGAGGYYKVGKPYQIKGEWYYPKEDYSYDESGIASWYGADFHEQATANGEQYNKNELTAAHKTLPLPSLARVTNLENGRSIVVRVNDRGPFSGARIIDVSQRAAQLLGFEGTGTAKVRVQVLADESKAIADAMRTYGGPSQTSERIVASAQTPNPPMGSNTIAPVQVMPFDQAADASPKAPVPLSLSNVQPVPEYVQLPVTGGHLIYVQAGAFTNSENAKKLSHSLSKIGQTKVAQAQVKGVQYYRVRVGPIASVADADKMLKRVRSSGADAARIIVD